MNWVAFKALRAGWYQFWKDCRRLPKKVWQRWAGTLAIGLGICAVLTFAMTVIVKGYVDQGLQAWDARTLLTLVDKIPLSFSRSITWESPGNSLGSFPIVVVFTGIMIARSRPLLAATMVVGYILQFALVWIGWGYWNRARPDLIADGVAASGLHSFPSGHTIVIITIYGLMAYLWWRASHSWLEKTLVILLGVVWNSLIMASRLELGAHWPTDVIVGFIVGILWLTTIITALRRAESAMSANQEKYESRL
ncbi:phosphatase PAP2 family protein [Oscillatoria sp. CS-180]|uniref:phosphatase PAP2 family protein n=1 Tax=Oscillatoria sp. CS-180 TaxID=3021720 RepID=UPI00232E5326|nr:phosphatase PAP2 family protein [Oscillatoria sp. CS-180]MDB9524731.1 phosphatase PAP2 family protein [Oscillatoria sp. CS-180]